MLIFFQFEFKGTIWGRGGVVVSFSKVVCFCKVRGGGSSVKMYKQVGRGVQKGQFYANEIIELPLRKEIMQFPDFLPWPPQTKNLESDKFTIPNKLSLIMRSLLNDKDEQSSRTDRLRYSFGQDIIYAATKVRVRTPKSILFPSIVKTLTNNTTLINNLNWLGYGVSYSLLMEAQTDNAF